MKKILERLDPLLATHTVVVFGGTAAFAGVYLALVEGKSWGLLLFLPGYILGLHAAYRVGRINKQLRKNRGGIILGAMLVFAFAKAATAILYQVDTAAFTVSLLVSVAMFVSSLALETFLDRKEYVSENG